MPARRIAAACPAQKASRQAQVDEARPGDLHARDVRIGLEPHRNLQGKLARLSSERLGQHHRRIGRDVAMRGVARRLGRDPVERAGCSGKAVRADDALHRCADPLLELGEEVHR